MQLPDITLTIELLTKDEFARIRGMESRDRVDLSLYDDGKAASTASKKRKKSGDVGTIEPAPAETAAASEKASEKKPRKGELQFFKVTCKVRSAIRRRHRCSR
jgi:hypothetical protein